MKNEVSFRTQVIVTLVGIAFYALAWVNGSAYHAPLYLQQAVAVGVGSMLGVTLHRWRLGKTV